MLFIAALILIVVKAVYDGLKTRGLHIVSEIIEFFYLAFVTIVFFAFLLAYHNPVNVPDVLLWKALIGFILLRFAIFDIIWNLSAGKSIFYIGTTKCYDKTLQWLVDRIGIGSLFFIRFVCLCISIGLLFNLA
jgi:hypothetical protein